MFAHCSVRTCTLAPVTVASTKVALGLKGLLYVLQNLKNDYLQGCVMSGHVLLLCKGGTAGQDMSNAFGGLIA